MPAGQVLTREGAPGSEFFVIVDGAVEIDVHGQTVRTMESGDFLGEIALVDDGPRTATATTTTPTKLLVLGRREFRSLMDLPTRQSSTASCTASSTASGTSTTAFSH